MPVLDVAKHEQVAQLVAGGADGRNAYVSVYGACKGAAQSASRLLKNAKVRARVSELQREMAAAACKKAGLSREWVLDRLKKNVEWCGELMNAPAEPDGTRRFAGNVLTRTLELIGREYGMFKTQLEVSGSVDLAARLAAGRQRVREARETKDGQKHGND